MSNEDPNHPREAGPGIDSTRFDRESLRGRLEADARNWDLIVIGGGATGLGAAVEAVSRGYRTLLFEQGDFAGGTSSRSTKLIHGGVRYLRQGNVRLVRESLRERGRLLRNAPGLVRPITFALPARAWWELGWYGAGLKLYDALAGDLGIAPSRVTGRRRLVEALPALQPEAWCGGVFYQDAQFDDARLALALVRTLIVHGGTALNYVRVERLVKENGRVQGVIAHDLETGRETECRARVIVNAAGVFADEVSRLDDPGAPDRLALSRGSHIVLAREFFPGNTALIIPRTDDGRVLFAIPWLNHVVVGTTDVAAHRPEADPLPDASEVEYLLSHLGRHLVRPPGREDILSAWAGLRPLARASGERSTSRVPRDHVISRSATGLITVTGGKWTTYRQMGEDVVDAAEAAADWPHRPSQTAGLQLEAPRGHPETATAPNPELALSDGDIRRAVHEELARTLEDVLARRTRILLLDARAALGLAPRVAETMATELGRDETWRREQLKKFNHLAGGYLAN